MKYKECKPGTAVFHNNGFSGIISNRVKESKFDSELILVEIITTCGDSYWAYPEFLIKYERGL